MHYQNAAIIILAGLVLYMYSIFDWMEYIRADKMSYILDLSAPQLQ